MTERNATPAGDTPGGDPARGRAVGRIGLALLAAGLVALGAATGFCFRPSSPDGEPPAAAAAPPIGKEPTVGGLPVFSSWPKDAKPDAVVVLSGQTFGFLQPCGCSRPQMGGLERRANFIAGLKTKGWPVVAADLGDVYPAKGTTDQSLLKYAATMNALRDMGYVAVGTGKLEYTAGLLRVVAEYALQKERPPFTLAGNVVGLADGKPVPRDAFFPAAPGGTRTMVGSAEVADAGAVAVGFVGVVGPTLAKEAVKLDPSIDFEGNKAVLAAAAQALAAGPKKPAVSVLLYQGTAEEARKVAADWPQFQVILCQADDDEPPQFPEYVAHPGGGKTMVVQVGHKGKYVGAVGVFKKPGGGFDLTYQLVPMSEEYLTPDDPAAEKASRTLAILEEYAKQVKDRNLMGKVPQAPHPAQLQEPKQNLTFVGSEKCTGCHAAEYVKWKGSPHAHAYETLEVKAKRPGLRQFDAECVVCHTVGFGYKSGFTTADKTPALKNNGCENCHGPGSGHVAAPQNAQLYKLLSPWKQDKGDKLPDAATMDKLAALSPRDRGQVPLTPAQNRVVNAVERSCMKCHDGENDPHFDLYKYWPKVTHSGLANGGLPGAKK